MSFDNWRRFDLILNDKRSKLHENWLPVFLFAKLSLWTSW